MNEILSLRDIDVTFAKKGKAFTKERYVNVLNGINLDIYKGEILAVVGESGCGKTTTGKIITGLIKPTKGKIYYEGEQVTKVPNVQFVQQDSYAALNPVNTVYQSLYYAIKNGRKGWKRGEIDERICELFSLIGLQPAEQYLSKYPHQLSGGQRQRVLMARAIALNPKLIVADEPVSMIDVSLRISILNLMKELNQKLGITFVYITHDLSTARYIAKSGRICVMYLGEIVEIGDIDKIISTPSHPYTKALIAAVPDIYDNDYADLPLKSMELGNLENRGVGCVFFERCPYADEQCRQKIDYTKKDGVLVKCRKA